MRISYAKFLQLLKGNRIKRLIIYGDLRTAIVEVRHSMGGGPATGLGQCPCACVQDLFSGSSVQFAAAGTQQQASPSWNGLPSFSGPGVQNAPTC